MENQTEPERVEPEVNYFHVLNRTSGQLGARGYENKISSAEYHRGHLSELDYTVAYIVCPETMSIIASRSVRHPHDRFVKKKGRENAYNRLHADVAYDSYFDATFEIEEYMTWLGVEDVIRNLFRPAVAENMMNLIDRAVLNVQNLAGGRINDFLEQHFDEVSRQQYGRFGLGCDTEHVVD